MTDDSLRCARGARMVAWSGTPFLILGAFALLMDWWWVVVPLAVGVLATLGVALARRRGATLLVASGLRAMREGRPARPAGGRFGGAMARLVREYDALARELGQRTTALEQERVLFEAVLEAMSEGVIAVDGRRRVLFANGAARAVFGFEPKDVGRLFAEVVRHPQLQQVVDAAAVGHGPRREEVELTAGRWPEPGGGGAILSVQVRPMGGDGAQGLGAVLVFHDITELRRLERMRQDFVANVSHELKTPLAAIKAYTETLIDGAIDDASVNREFLQRIEEQAERLNQLVLDMLSLSRIERGEGAFTHRPLAVSPLVRSIADSHAARAAAKGQELALRLGNVDEGVLVRIDAEALRQILNNLIENAVKYTPAGGRVVVACRAREEHVEFEVTDTGIGIARDELPRIFERFYRVDKARGRAEPGTGLGLAIVKHLVQSLGGRVTVRSRLNAGSTFTVSLPRARGGEREPGAVESALLKPED